MSQSAPLMLKLSVLGCVPLLGLLVFPLMVGGFVDDLGMSERDAGLVGSAAFLGAALGSLLLAFNMHLVSLKRVALIGLVGLAIMDGISIAAPFLPVVTLVLVRFASGLANAAVFGAVMGTFAGWRRPDRAYGAFMAAQFSVSAVGLFFLPRFMPGIGISGLFALFVVMDLVGLLLVIDFPARRCRGDGKDRLNWRIILAPTSLLCLLAYGLFESTQMAEYTYIERIGVALALTPEQLGFALGLASLVGIPAAFAVTLFGSRFGYFRPIALVASVQIIMMIWLMNAGRFGEYLVIVCCFASGWAFVLPYFQGMAARIDPQGSVVVAGGVATGSAGFIGPVIAALLVGTGDYSRVLIAVVIGLVLVIVLTGLTIRRLAIDKSGRL